MTNEKSKKITEEAGPEEQTVMDEHDKDDDSTDELEENIAELTSGWQRTQADFSNYKRQVEQERSQLIKTANADLIEAILPVLDNFALAAKHLPKELEGNSWAQGIKQIEKQLENVLVNEGLERIESVGKPFDPELHEACGEIESDRPEDETVEEIAPGYRYHNIVLRPARVKLATKAKGKQP